MKLSHTPDSTKTFTVMLALKGIYGDLEILKQSQTMQIWIYYIHTGTLN